MSNLPKDVRFFKNQFRHLNYYTLPTSILYILRKRLNFVILILSLLILISFSVL